ncbi:hypothetical protein [Burkholderia sp. 8Y]|nr:hypothetical protein [Burkholderia sp. 8Y]
MVAADNKQSSCDSLLKTKLQATPLDTIVGARTLDWQVAGLNVF